MPTLQQIAALIAEYRSTTSATRKAEIEKALRIG